MTERQALIESIRHWTTDYKILELFGGKEEHFDDVFSRATCPLCKYHRLRPIPGCRECPLVDCRDKDGEAWGCQRRSQYRHAWRAHDSEDKPTFLRARCNIIRRMTRALARLDKETPDD